jgi:hypothetical protein
MQSAEKKKVIDAINALGRQVTAADVSTKTGLPLSVATHELNCVAADTGGTLQVASSGDIAYKFNLGFQTAYFTKGVQRTFEQIGQQVFRIGYYLLKISFGIMLVVSFILVIGLIIVAIMAMNSGNDRDRDSGFNLSFLDWRIIEEIFFWNTFYAPPTPIGYDNYHQPSSKARRDGNFLLDCFSFLFGDGDPNNHLEERKWHVVAEAIRARNGVITNDELAPYTAANPKNEDGALPVLVRFDGRPEVTDTGNIVYTFPSLQVKASSSQDKNLPRFLEEFIWPFTSAPAESLIPVYILASVNFLGSWWLVMHEVSIPALMAFAPVISFLVFYGTAFVTVPLLRWLYLLYANAGIEKRNTERKNYANLLVSPEADLARKLAEAKQFQIKDKQITKEDVVYSTDKDLLDQEFAPPGQ